MAGLRAALLPLVLQLTSLALVSVTGGGKSGRRRLAGGPAGPCLSLSPARGKELGPDCLPPTSRPGGCERLPGQLQSSPSEEEPAWGRAGG